MSKRYSLVMMVLSLLVIMAPPAYSGGGGGLSGGATEMTQLENNSELVKQLQEQVEQTKKLFEQYQNMLQNTMQLPMELWSQLSGEFMKVQNIFNSMQDIVQGSLQNLTDFQLDYPSFGKESEKKKQNFEDQYEDMSKKNDEVVAKAAEGLQTSIDSIKNAKGLNDQIMAAGRSSEGQMQALQTGINALGAINDNLMNLHMTIAEQRAAELETQQIEKAKEDAKMEAMKEAIGTWKPNSSARDWSKEGF